MTKTTIQFVLTGGTIDLAYHQREGAMRHTHIVEKILSEGHFPHHRILVKRLFKIDSLKITSSQIKMIFDFINRSNHENFIVVHGTDNLIKTGQFLKTNLAKSKTKKPKRVKRVILTGAMVPFSVNTSYLGGGSDGNTNIAQSVALMEYLPKIDEGGVWIVFHGKVFDPDRVEKDYSRLIFVEK